MRKPGRWHVDFLAGQMLGLLMLLKGKSRNAGAKGLCATWHVDSVFGFDPVIHRPVRG